MNFGSTVQLKKPLGSARPVPHTAPHPLLLLHYSTVKPFWLYSTVKKGGDWDKGAKREQKGAKREVRERSRAPAANGENMGKKKKCEHGWERSRCKD